MKAKRPSEWSKPADAAWLMSLVDAMRGSGALELPLLAFMRDLPEASDRVRAAADAEEAALLKILQAQEDLRAVREQGSALLKNWTRAEVVKAAVEHHGWSWLPTKGAEEALRDAELNSLLAETHESTRHRTKAKRKGK